MNNQPHISVVTPVYGCKTCLAELYLRLKSTLEQINPEFEIILVNDASPDGAWETIVELAKKDVRVKGINLSRNFGQHYAITAGLTNAKGDWIIVMDCDLQDQPEEIINLFSATQDGSDIIIGQRLNRKDKFFKRITSKIFFKLYSYFTETEITNAIGNFAIYSKTVIEAYKKINERDQAIILFINWLGFNVKYIPVNHNTRYIGKSSYNIRKLINLAINNIVSQSNKPLRLSIKIGFLIAVSAFLYGIILIYRHFTEDLHIGWASIMVSIFFIGGLIIANLGILGLYMGKIYDETKKRPLYIIKETIGI